MKKLFSVTMILIGLTAGAQAELQSQHSLKINQGLTDSIQGSLDKNLGNKNEYYMDNNNYGIAPKRTEREYRRDEYRRSQRDYYHDDYYRERDYDRRDSRGYYRDDYRRDRDGYREPRRNSAQGIYKDNYKNPYMKNNPYLNN